MQVLLGRHVLLGPWSQRERLLYSRELVTRQRRRQSVPLLFDPNSPLADLSALQAEAAHANLFKGIDAARAALQAAGLLGLHAKLIVLVDDSASMQPDWRAVQKLLVRLFGFALLLSPSLNEAKIPMLAYSRYVAEPIVVDVDNYQQADVLLKPNFGDTPMAEALMRAVELSWENGTLTIIINLTDGWPTNEQAMTNEVIRFGSYPAILKNVALKPVAYLDKLDDMPSRVEVCQNGGQPLRDGNGHLVLRTNRHGRRLMDNVSSVAIDPYTATDLQFAMALAREVKPIIETMGCTGQLTGVPNVKRRYWYFPRWALAA